MNHKSILRRFIKFACLLALGVGLAAQASAQSKTLLNLDQSGVAVRGYDPVAFFSDGQPVKGIPQFTSSLKGATYYFASAEHKAAFNKEPAKYEPQFGGYCASGVTRGKTVPIKDDAFQVVNDRLLLQYDKGIRDKFNKDTRGNLKLADQLRALGHEVGGAKVASRGGALTIQLEPATKLIAHLREWFPGSLLVGWEYALDGAPAEAIGKAHRQVIENHTDACIVNGRAYGDGFGIVQSSGCLGHLGNKERLCAFLVSWSQMPQQGRERLRDAILPNVRLQTAA